MSGLSKISGLPQMKVAWLVTNGPEDLKEQAVNRLEVIADIYLSMNAPTQGGTTGIPRTAGRVPATVESAQSTNWLSLIANYPGKKLALDSEGRGLVRR